MQCERFIHLKRKNHLLVVPPHGGGLETTMLDMITENLMFKIAVFVFAALCIISIFSFNAEKQELAAQKEALEEEISRREEEILAMENDLSKPYDDEYIIRVAREKLNMRLPEEIVFITDYRK